MNPDRFTRPESGDLAPIDLIPDPVIGVDADRRITLWNRAATRTYGFTRAQALGRRPPDLLVSRFPIPLLEIVEAVADAGHWRGDVVQRAQDGRELLVESRWTVRYDEHGNVSGGVQIDREVSDLQDSGEFAHELNNLLTVILNYAAVIAGELEAMDLASPNPRWAVIRQDLSEVQLAGERAARLIHGLGARSRVVDGR